MPVYDYKCREHGHFYQLARMDDAAKPAACPACGVMSARVIVLPPELRGLDRDRQDAQTRNEKARHEPVFSTADSRAEADDRARHAAQKGCGCDHTERRHSKLFYTADGKKMFPSMRPWMISH